MLAAAQKQLKMCLLSHIINLPASVKVVKCLTELAKLHLKPAKCCMLQISVRGQKFCGIVLALSQYGVLSVPAVFGCLRSALCSPLTSLALASLHAVGYTCGAVAYSNSVSKLTTSLQEVYLASGMSFTTILPQVSNSGISGIFQQVP